MTDDEMIEAERRIVALHRGYAEGSRQFAEIMTGQWDALFENDILLIRAAIRVIAPAVLEEAEKVCAVMVGNHFDRIETQVAIRAMKTRYEQ